MAKVFQIINGTCYWLTPFKSLRETVGKFPADCLFVEAPDYVHESWGYQEKDTDGNILPEKERFIKPAPPEGWLYDDDTDTFYPKEKAANYLEKFKLIKQNDNKRLFAEYLSKNPLTWLDGKLYGITLEDQTEILFNITQYRLQLEHGIEPVLEWHAIKEKCVEWSYEDLINLFLAINEYIYPHFTKMNEYKEKIFNAESVTEINKIEIKFGEE